MNPVLYLTVEIRDRDLDSRLLIAAHAVEMGYTVIVGQQWFIFNNFHRMPPGIVLFKTANKIQTENMANAKKFGNLVATNDEEILACGSEDCFLLAVNDEALELCDIFFAQSEPHRAALKRKFPKMGCKIHVTGNPRADLIGPWGRTRYLKLAEQIRAEHGRYILFNTNYSRLNSIWGNVDQALDVARRAGTFDPDDKASVDAVSEDLAWESRNRAEIINVMKWTSDNLKDHKVVIRPHPGEKAEYWDDLCGHVPNIRIVRETDHIPWTLGAELLVHTSCSTGTEAALLNTPAVSLTPMPEAQRHELVLSNQVNPTFKNWNDACHAIYSYFNENTGPLANKPSTTTVIESYFPNKGAGESASTMTNHMTELLEKRGASASQDYAWKPLPGGLRPVPRRDVWKHKFSVEAEEVIGRIEDLRPLAGLTRPIKLTTIAESLFKIFPNYS